MANLKLSPPWIILAKEITELFRNDPLVHTLYDDDRKEVKLYVDDAKKAAALDMILPKTRDFGGVVLTITVYPANPEKVEFEPGDKIWDIAFAGNSAFRYSRYFPGVLAGITYIVFRNTVVQYYTDNLGSMYGLESTLYEKIMKDIFADTPMVGIFFCTDLPDATIPLPMPVMPLGGLSNPLGEWP